jgi:two-component system response regulator YesN
LARVLEENGFDAEALNTEGRPSGTTEDAERRVLDVYRSVIEEYAGLNGIRHAPAMARALDHIRKNLDRDLTADDLAAFLQKSPNYFSHLFKKEFGVSFSEYLNRARIREAKRLMRTTNLLSYEIAEKIGYRDYRYFVEVFKKLEGCPPSEYRKS